MYSSGNPTNIANPIKDATVQVDIKTVIGKLTLYQTTLCEKLSWDDLDSDINLAPIVSLGTYNKNDVQLICCQAESNTLWLVPDPVQARFIQSLDWDVTMDISFTWVLFRDRPKGKEVVKNVWNVKPQDLPERADVQKVLNGSMKSLKIKNAYPRYFRVTGSGEIRELEVCDALPFFYLLIEVCDALPDFFIHLLPLLLCLDLFLGVSSKTPPYVITLSMVFLNFLYGFYISIVCCRVSLLKWLVMVYKYEWC